MFLKNKCTEFNLRIALPALIGGWQSKHNVDLSDAQREVKEHVLWRSCSVLIAFLGGVITGVVLPRFGFSRVISGYETSLAIDLIIGVSLGLLISTIFWFIIESIGAPYSVVQMREFVRAYPRAMDALTMLGFSFDDMSFRDLHIFVTRMMTARAAQIREFEVGTTYARPASRKTIMERGHKLRREFATIFDALKPFGLIYSSYEHYFDPEFAYLDFEG